jgi:hypothetical protein
MCALWWIGGWLISSHVFRIRQREGIWVGFALGWLLFIVLSNILAQIISLSAGLWLAAFVIILFGVWVGRHSLGEWRPFLLSINRKIDGIALALFLGVFLIFLLINRGLALFNDYFNLPIVSLIAAGELPPPFHLNPNYTLDYHYGLHLFAASLVRIGGLFPWSAFDLTVTLSMALMAVLSWMWFRRFTTRQTVIFAGVALVLFATGARWLLILFPTNILQQFSVEMQPMGSVALSASDLPALLAGSWEIDGAGPLPFPMAYINGIFLPGVLNLGGSGCMPQVTLLLLLLLRKEKWNALAGGIYGVLLGSLALTAEHFFLMLWAGYALAVLIRAWQRRSIGDVLNWGWVLLPSAILAIAAGGVLTETFSRMVRSLLGLEASSGISFIGLQFRWFPAIVSAHLGTLPLFNPKLGLIALFELGPVFLVLFLILRRSIRGLRSLRIAYVGLGLASLIGFTLPLFVDLIEDERDIARFTGSALIMFIILGFPIIWRLWKKFPMAGRAIIASGFLISIFGGIVVFSAQWLSIGSPIISHRISEIDAVVSKKFWDQLEPGSYVIDLSVPFRSTVLFARTTAAAYRDIYNPLPEYTALVQNPRPDILVRAGYSYVYLNRGVWQKFSAQERSAFQVPCVDILIEQRDGSGDFRRLYDIRKCNQ